MTTNAKRDVVMAPKIAEDGIYGAVRSEIVAAAQEIAKTRGLQMADVNCVYAAAVSLLHQARMDRVRELEQMASAGALWRDKNPDASVIMLGDLLGWLVARIREQESQLGEYDRLFEVQWRRMMEAITLWRRANPGNELVMPDLGDLLTWMMNRMRTLEAKLQGAAA
jgi:hypothetical protein